MPGKFPVRSSSGHWQPASIAVVALVAVTLAAGFAYWPGLAGDYLFDDFANLPALGRYGGIRSVETLLYYLSSGIADPTGRPISMLSFLLDARDWPADPRPFKRTNLLIHLGNGLVLYSVLVALGRRMTADAVHVRGAALLATSLWLLHPLWVSTVLYVIQRQAMLATLFALFGIRAWIASCEAFAHGRVGRGWVLAVLAVPVFGALAGLSKANGFLLPLLLAVLQLTVLRPSRARAAMASARSAQSASLLFVWLPAAALLTWLALHGYAIGLDGHGTRSWNLGQRLLSQPRALCDYLYHLLVPGLNTTGVFADGFEVSQSWHAPRTTVPSLLVLGALASLGWAVRMRVPVLAAGIGFFLAGHAMESSVVMLELYFEHRNYLPSLLLFWPLAWMLTSPGRYRRWLVTGAVGYALVMLLATTAQAALWADPLSLARTWAEGNPGSARAQTYAAIQERAAGYPELAEQRLEALTDHDPDEPQYAINLLDLRCAQGRVTTSDVDRAASALHKSGGVTLDLNYHWLSNVLLPESGAACGGLSDAQRGQLLQAALIGTNQTRNASAEVSARANHVVAHQALGGGECDRALRAFDRRIAVQPRPEFVQTQVGLLANHCSAGTGLSHLRTYLDAGAPIAHAHTPALRLRDSLMREFWAEHWQTLQQTLQAEIDVDEPALDP